MLNVRRRPRYGRPPGLVLVLLLLALAGGHVAAQEGPAPPTPALPQPVAQALARAQIPPSALALVVQEVRRNDARLSNQAQTAVNPASLMKLVTTFAALELLGPTYAWRTGVYAHGTLNGQGVLEGDLVLRGSGDPKLVVEQLWLLLRRLQAAGVREIRGDIVLDRSAFDVGELDTARFDGEGNRPYNVGADALLLNFKSVSWRFTAQGGAALASAEPRLAGMPASIPVRALPGDCGDWRAKLGADFSDPLQPRFAGGFPGACGDAVWHQAVLGPQRYAQALIGALWGELGGRLTGTIREGRVPAGARLLFDWPSPPLADVIRDINKFSNNVMARQLFLTLALEATQQPATAGVAERVVKDWAQARGLAMPELVMENGSGLSRIERISAASLARLLQAAYAAPTMPEFIGSLPIAGLDGTMRRRRGHVAQGSAHLKTGSLNGVAGIAGYVLAQSGRRYVLVAIVNHPNAQLAREAFDALLAHVYQAPGF
jgi:D-alanyl-D-alanine carboxypeptidase/D-alanyl-D-alanine-endopeptidase (penicillin-binding protein 4)